MALLGCWRRRDRAWLLICAAVGLGLSASTALPGGVSSAGWLAARVPILGAYREPQKWSALWLLALVVLAAGAVESTARSRGRRSAATALAYTLVLAALLPAGVSQIRSVSSIVSPVVYPGYW